MRQRDARRFVSDLAGTWPIDAHRWSEFAATVLVADVTGFTRLSDRLAPLGAVGSEAVKDLINAVFEPCLAVALSLGGDVLKFSGDGFTCLFSGSAHAERAAGAAADMQRGLASLGTRSTPVGPARPRMRIGVESGTIIALTLGVAGQARQDVVATGSALDAAFALERVATPGQVRVGPTLATMLPTSWMRRLRGGDGVGLAVRHVPEIDDRQVRRPGARQDARRFLDPAVALLAERGSTPPEHRTVAVAFIVVDGTTRLWNAAGPDGLVAALGELSATVARACGEHDVCWLESDSEHDRVRLMLTVGVPHRHENDTARLAEAVHTIATQHRVRAGISSGRAFVGDVGHPERSTYNVMGPVVNLAARLAGASEPGTTLVTGVVAETVASHFVTVPQGDVQLKGLRRPVSVARLGDRRVLAMPPRSSGPLRGRDVELLAMHSRVEAVRGGSGAAIEIVADAGVGKSRFVEEVQATADTPTLCAEGRWDRRATPYAAVAPMMRALLGVSADADPAEAGDALLATLVANLPTLAGFAPLVASTAHAAVTATEAADSVDPSFRSARTRELTVELIAALRPGHTLFVAEDVHWFDPASGLLLSALANLAATREWLVVATRRPVGPPLAGFETVHLVPLPTEHVRSIVTDAIGDAPLARHQLDAIAAASAGNPLFAHELSRSSASGATNAVMPDRVEEIIASRIDQLDVESRLMLRDLSVAGIEADHDVVDALVTERSDPSLRGLDGFVTVTDGAVRFRHDLYRRVAYDGMPVRRRRELHQRLSDLLAGRHDAGTRAATIAEHAHQAGDASATWEWARAAAAEASRQGASHEAALQLQRAVTAATALDVEPLEQARVAELLGDALDLSGQPGAAHVAYRRARQQLAGDDSECARLCRKHARVDERAGRYRSALRWTTTGLKLVADDRSVVAAELHLAAGVVRFFQGRFDQAIGLAHRAMAAASVHDATAPLARAHLQLEMAYSELGRKAERAHHAAVAQELFERLDDRLGLANLHLNLGVSAYNESDWRAALEQYERSAMYYRQVGDTIGTEAARNNQAEILTDQGRLDDAAAILEGVERSLRAAQYPLGIAITRSGRARIALRQGDHDRAEALLTTARADFVHLDARHMVIDTDVRRVEHLVWSRRPMDALRLADDVVRELSEAGPVAVLPATLARLQGWAELLLGRVDPATDRFREALALAGDDAFPYEIALALDALDAVGTDRLDDSERERLGALLVDLDVGSTPRPPWMAPGDGALADLP